MSERPSADLVIVRSGRPEDVSTVLRFWKEATSVASSTDDPPSVRTLLARDPEALLVAELDGRIIGTLIVGWDGWRAGLYRLAVDPQLRRLGIGGSLVREAERRLAEVGARRVAVVVIGEHDHAVGFWRAMGYEHDARVGRFVRDLPAE
jgi:ribosomal protein S18 acetylase RimI-like enzyme